MNYSNFATYSETYKINGKYYKATVDFVKKPCIYFDGGGSKIKIDLDEYTKFNGDMEQFVNSKIRGLSI